MYRHANNDVGPLCYVAPHKRNAFGGILIIKFKKWESFNPPSSKTNSWFRLNSNIVSRPIWDELDNDGFRVFIYLLCQANESDHRGSIHVTARQASRRCTVSEKSFNHAIKILKTFQVIEVRTPSGHFAGSEETLPTYDTNERTDETKRYIQADSAAAELRCVFDFNSLYQKYPRKEGKASGILQCRKQIKTQADFDSLSAAIDRYAAHCAKTDQIIKHFSSFLGSEKTGHPWRDWLDPDAGTAAGAKDREYDWDSFKENG